KVKAQVGPEHASRYALVEVENVHDEGLIFEPIHRVLFEVKGDFKGALEKEFGENLKWIAVSNGKEMIQSVHEAQGIGIIGFGETFAVAEIANSKSNLPVGTIQPFLDSFLKAGGVGSIDYIHGDEAVVRLGGQPGNIGVY